MLYLPASHSECAMCYPTEFGFVVADLVAGQIGFACNGRYPLYYGSWMFQFAVP